jgi:hypothetical protein
LGEARGAGELGSDETGVIETGDRDGADKISLLGLVREGNKSYGF